MAKLTGFIALFVVAMLIANACAYRTTITTVEIDEGNQGRTRERCREMTGRHQLRNCQQFLRQQRRGALLLREIDDNQREQQLDECCQELRQVDQECRCDQLRKIVQEQQQRERGEGRQMLEKARNLPAMCRLQPQRCDF